MWIFGGQNDTGTGLFCWAKWHWSWFVLMGKMALVLVYFVGQNGTGAGLFCWAKWHWYWFILLGKMALVLVYFGGQNGTGNGLFPTVCLLRTIPPVLHTHSFIHH